MKQETNNEIDLLLRRLGRRDGLSAPAAGDHLDADELNAYAENVLPVASRARYTEHLADCASCRKLVVQLSAAAGVVVAPETVKVTEPSVLKKFLASLFSPMVLRYAAPALGLIVVGVIGLVVMRRNNSRELVTQLQQAPASVSPNQETPKPFSGEFGKQKTEPAIEGAAKQAPANTKPAEPVAAPTTAPAGGLQTGSASDAAGPKREQVAVESEPPPPVKEESKPASTTLEPKQQVVVVQPKTEVASAAPASQPSTNRNFEERRDRQETDLAADRARGNRKAPATAARSAGIAKLGDNEVDKLDKAESKEKAADAKKDDEAETRSVGGRHFRKQRGIWIDTAYDSGSTTNLKRGSEQYRALVGDEPAIKTIADALDGEIIVVWKGRAYRIR